MKKIFDGKISKDEYDTLIHKGYVGETCTISSSEYKALQKHHGKEIKMEIFDGSKLKVKVIVDPDPKQLSKGALEVEYKIQLIQ